VRQVYAVALAAGAHWPEAASGVNLPRFNWLKIDNRGTGDVYVSLRPLDQVDTPPAATDYVAKVSAGKMRVLNLAGPSERAADGSEHARPGEIWPQELHVFAAAATTIEITVSDTPIVDTVWTP
jgi:hypothetical protein